MKSENDIQFILMDSLVKVLREFGVVGVLLLSLSVFIAYFRLKIQRDREQYLIDMTKNTGNRLAEQLGKNLSKEQVEAIVQKIRQNQRDLMDKILGSLENKQN